MFKSAALIGTDSLARHVRFDVNALSGTVDLTSKTPDTILLIGDNGSILALIPAYHVHKTSFEARLAAATRFSVNLDLRTHDVSGKRYGSKLLTIVVFVKLIFYMYAD